MLIAQWRILSQGGEKLLKAGAGCVRVRWRTLARETGGAVATLSELVADLSRQLAQALQETASRQAAPISK